MLREIKFRAWDKKRKRIYEVSSLHIAEPTNGGIWATVIGKDVIEDKDIKLQIQPKDIEISQYTGLKDKNGKEIYEGDINIEDNGKKSIIKYYSGGFYLNSGKVDYVHIGKFAPFDLSIIGNIYETPELLK